MYFFILNLILSFCLLFFGADFLSFEVVGLLTFFFYLGVYSREVKGVRTAWLLPPVLASFIMFIYIWMGCLLLSLGQLTFTRFNYNIFSDENLNKANLVTVIALCSMWIAYQIFIKKNKPASSLKWKLNKWKGMIIVILSVALYFYGVSKGYIGYGADESKIGTFSNFISISSSVAFLVLILYYLQSFTKKKVLKWDISLWVIISLLVLKGIMSGSKFAMINPFLYLIFIHYYKKGKVFSRNMIYGFLIFLIGFMIIPTIRDATRSNENINYSILFSTEESKSAGDALSDMLYRVTYVPPLVLALNYRGESPPSVSNLWNYTLMSPINAIIPRIVNPDKPRVTFGRWFSFNVYGSTEQNNVGATYQGILFLAGGITSVILGFMLIGAVQALIVNLFYNDYYFPIYLLLLLNLVLLPQEPWILFVELIQLTVVLLIFYKILLK